MMMVAAAATAIQLVGGGGGGVLGFFGIQASPFFFLFTKEYI